MSPITCKVYLLLLLVVTLIFKLYIILCLVFLIEFVRLQVSYFDYRL